MRKKVLVFPCGSEIGLEIYKSVSMSTHFDLFGGSSTDDHGKFVYDKYIGDMPFVDDVDFTEKLNSIVKDHEIDFIFPAHDSVVLKLAQLKASGLVACEVVTSIEATCEIARSKRKTYQIFKNIIPTPKMFDDINEVTLTDFPVFLKPDVGQGSKGTYIASSYEDIEFYTKKDNTLITLEFLPGKEYTVDCFTNKDGELAFCLGRERARVGNGISVSSKEVNDDRFKKLALAINQRITFRGVWFFQVKENTAGDLVLMEIAPRVAGTMGLSRSTGVNLALLSLFDACGYDVDINKNSYEIEIDRALQNRYRHNISYSHVYLDFDDLLVFEEKVNPIIVSFIFQCINEGVKVYLITRHKRDIHLTLEKYRLKNLFDEIIWIRNDDLKSSYIKHMDAIFIDDSHAERQEISKKFGLPVFDAHNIEALLRK